MAENYLVIYNLVMKVSYVVCNLLHLLIHSLAMVHELSGC